MQTITGKFYQRESQNGLVLFGIIAVLAGIILTVNAFRDLSVPQSPQEHVKQFIAPVVAFVFSYLMFANHDKYEGDCKITFENDDGKLKLTIAPDSGEKYDVHPVSKYAFYIKNVEPNPWLAASRYPRGSISLPVWSTFLELNITTVAGLQIIFCEKFIDSDNLDIPVVRTRAPYGSDYTSSDPGTLAKVEQMLRTKAGFAEDRLF